MKIYEVTFPVLQEGVLDDLGRRAASAATGIDFGRSQDSINKDVAKTSAALAAQGYGPGGFDPNDPKQATARKALSSNWADKIDTIRKNPAQVEYINQIAQAWKKQLPSLQAQVQPQAQPQAQAQKTQAQAQAQAKTGTGIPMGASVTIGSVGKLTKSDDGLWYNEQGQAVTDPAQATKIDKAYQDQELRKSQFKQTSVVKEQDTVTPGGIVIPSGSKTATKPTANAAPADAVKDRFLAWTDQQLTTKDSAYNVIKMDQVRRANLNGIAQELDKKLEDVISSNFRDDAVKAYLLSAVAGISAYSQDLKQKEMRYEPTGTAATTAGGADDVMSTMQTSGLKPEALKTFGSKLKSKEASSTNNPELDALLKSMNVRVRP